MTEIFEKNDRIERERNDAEFGAKRLRSERSEARRGKRGAAPEQEKRDAVPEEERDKTRTVGGLPVRSERSEARLRSERSEARIRSEKSEARIRSE